MKKVLLLIPSFLLIQVAFAQTKANDAFLDIYYGIPDWQKYIMRSDVYNLENVKMTSTGHIGGRVEYLVSKRIGFGLDMWYVNTTLTGTRVENFYDYSSSSGYYYTLVRTDKYEVKESLTRLSLLGRFIVHIGKSKKVDPYVHAGFGYANYWYNYTSKNNNDRDANNFFPLAARAGFGMRVFFTDNFGANVDLGLGGPLFTMGLTYKFPSQSTTE